MSTIAALIEMIQECEVEWTRNRDAAEHVGAESGEHSKFVATAASAKERSDALVEALKAIKTSGERCEMTKVAKAEILRLGRALRAVRRSSIKQLKLPWRVRRMVDRLTAEERARCREYAKESVDTRCITDEEYQMWMCALDSLDAAEAEVTSMRELASLRGDVIGEKNAEIARLQTLHIGRNDFLGVLFKEMTMILEGDCAEAKVRCAINRWCGLFESLEGSEPE